MGKHKYVLRQYLRSSTCTCPSGTRISGRQKAYSDLHRPVELINGHFGPLKDPRMQTECPFMPIRGSLKSTEGSLGLTEGALKPSNCPLKPTKWVPGPRVVPVGAQGAGYTIGYILGLNTAHFTIISRTSTVTPLPPPPRSLRGAHSAPGDDVTCLRPYSLLLCSASTGEPGSIPWGAGGYGWPFLLSPKSRGVVSPVRPHRTTSSTKRYMPAAPKSIGETGLLGADFS